MASASQSRAARRGKGDSNMSLYPGSRLANLIIDENANRRKDVQVGLAKNRATFTDEKFAVVVCNKLPEAAKDKSYRNEIVYRLMELLDKSELKQRETPLRVFLERVKKFLRGEPGKEWMHYWLQPDAPTVLSGTSNLPLSISNEDEEDRPVNVHVPLLPAPPVRISSQPSQATLPPQNVVHPDKASALIGTTMPSSRAASHEPGPVLSMNTEDQEPQATIMIANRSRPFGGVNGNNGVYVDANVPRASAVNVEPGVPGLISHRRWSSDSQLQPCPHCGSYHSVKVPISSLIVNQAPELVGVPRYDPGRGPIRRAPVRNRLMIVLYCLSVFGIVAVLERSVNSTLK